MKFPVVEKKKSHYPKAPRCPQCGRRKVLEPHSMAIISGSTTFVRRQRLNSGIADLAASLDIRWHGAHDSGIGDDRDIFTTVSLAEDCHDGEFQIHFCSTKCLRAFLNTWVDALETKIQNEKRRNAKNRQA
jgi:endogenous inhibitor of DNA gyrase (YacG/DUF329 family)